MYKLKIFKNSRNFIDDIISGRNLIELSERYYLYHQMCDGGFSFDLYKDEKLANREEFDKWISVYNKYIKEKKRLITMREDFYD